MTTIVSTWRTEKVLARLRRGESAGHIFNETGVPLATILTLRTGIAPDPPVSKRPCLAHRYVRQARKAGMTVAACAKHYGISKEEVLRITRKPPNRGNFPSTSTKAKRALKAEGFSEEQIVAVFGE